MQTSHAQKHTLCSKSGLCILQCRQEISRLEAEQAKAMKVMIQAKSAEIARLCEDTCLPVPNLGVLVDDVENPGQVQRVLLPLWRMLLCLPMKAT